MIIQYNIYDTYNSKKIIISSDNKFIMIQIKTSSRLIKVLVFNYYEGNLFMTIESGLMNYEDDYFDMALANDDKEIIISC